MKFVNGSVFLLLLHSLALITGSDGQLLRDLLKAADGIDWLQDSLAQLEALSEMRLIPFAT